MTYEKLIELVLAGKSVNARAKDLGIPQKSMDHYVKARSLPDCDVAIAFAEAAGISVEETVRAIATKKAELRPERAKSFLRPAVASVLVGILSVNLFLTPTPSEAAPALRLGSEAICIM
jgi:hypothetical protein